MLFGWEGKKNKHFHQLVCEHEKCHSISVILELSLGLAQSWTERNLLLDVGEPQMNIVLL